MPPCWGGEHSSLGNSSFLELPSIYGFVKSVNKITTILSIVLLLLVRILVK